MSLVNDMLRDLDARRREAPTRGLGAEKLVPATEAAARRSRQRALAIGVALLSVVTIAIVASLLTGREVVTGSLESVSLSPDTGAQAPVDAATASATVPANEDVQTQTEEPADETLRELTARLERLEQQNQSLREQTLQQSSSQTDLPQGLSAVQSNQQQTTAPWQPTNWTTEPVTPTVSVHDNANSQVSQPAARQPDLAADQSIESPLLTQENTGSGSRSPRELSFEDRDRQQVQLALQQWSSGQRLTALQTLDSFTYENAEAHRSRETLAKLLMQQGETERALQVVELGLTIAPRFTGYRKVKARVLLGEGSADEALGILSANAPSVSADTEYHDLLATAYLSAQRYDNAVVSYQMLLQQDESVGRWWYGMATAFEGQGRIADAIGAFDRALRSGGLSVTLRQNSQQKLQALRQTAGLN
jgi:MSHA biogenesis protein MshN